MDKRITIEVTGAPKVTGWLEDWLIAIYFAMTEKQRAAVREELQRREKRHDAASQRSQEEK